MYALKKLPSLRKKLVHGFLLMLMFLVVSPPAKAEPSLLDKCWTLGELKGKRSELRSRRGGRLKQIAKLKDISATKMLPITNELKGSIRRVILPKGQKLIAITFDLCEASYRKAGYDGGVIDYLRQHKIKSTLFVGGKWQMSHPVRTQQLLADPLFELGAHGWSHKNMRKISASRINRELSMTTKAFAYTRKALLSKQCSSKELSSSTLQKRMSLFRFPYGTCSPAALKAVHAHGQLAIQWDVVTGDPAIGQSARRIAAIIENRVKPGSIIIAHANGRGRNTAKALPLIIPKLLAKGYQFVTVSELLKAGRPVIKKTCYENRPGDNRHY